MVKKVARASSMAKYKVGNPQPNTSGEWELVVSDEANKPLFGVGYATDRDALKSRRDMTAALKDAKKIYVHK